MTPSNFNLAVRNVFRHRARSASALVAIIFGVIALLIASGFIEWIFWAMRESTIESQLGHVQIVKPGYFREGVADPFRYRLAENTADWESVRTALHVETVTPRLHFGGLISRSDNTVSFLGVGVEPATERDVSSQVYMIAGTDLDTSDGKQALLGEGLAAALDVKVADTVVLLVKTGSGGINAVELEVQGVFRTSVKAYDDVALRMPIATSQRLLRTEGAHVWVVLLDDTAHTDATMAALRARLSEQDYELVPWYEQAVFYNKTVTLFSRQVSVVWILIALVIVLSISNTMIMSVLERTREVGTLLALGFRRRQIMRQFLSEGLVLGAAGGVLGLILGAILAAIISTIGIPMPPPPGMEVGFTGEIILTGPLLAGAFALAVLTATLASVYPAWKASRLEIVDALRHNG